MQTAKLFANGRSQAVRLPKEFRFEGDEVYVKRVGSGVVLLPIKPTWDTLLQALNEFDTPIERAQPKVQQKREAVGVVKSVRKK